MQIIIRQTQIRKLFGCGFTLFAGFSKESRPIIIYTGKCMTSSFPTFLINYKRFVRLENLVINFRTILYATFSEIIISSIHTWKIEKK
jgi:hypothetical protein